jgi:hypothetical protein
MYIISQLYFDVKKTFRRSKNPIANETVDIFTHFLLQMSFNSSKKTTNLSNYLFLTLL